MEVAVAVVAAAAAVAAVLAMLAFGLDGAVYQVPASTWPQVTTMDGWTDIAAPLVLDRPIGFK